MLPVYADAPFEVAPALGGAVGWMLASEQSGRYACANLLQLLSCAAVIVTCTILRLNVARICHGLVEQLCFCADGPGRGEH
jgi:hypothetical protein